MYKLFHTLLIITIICSNQSAHGMKRKHTKKHATNKTLEQADETFGLLPDDLIRFIAADSEPKEKNALMLVCKKYNVCLTNKAPIIRLNQWTVARYAEMFKAACSGDAETMACLLDFCKLEVDHTNNLGMTPLHYAMENNQRKIVILLCQHDANLTTPKPEIHPLHNAVYKGDKEYVKALLAQKVSLNPTLKNGITPLALAIKEGRTEIAEMLKKAGAKEEAPANEILDQELLGPIRIHMPFHERMLRRPSAEDFREVIEWNKRNGR